MTKHRVILWGPGGVGEYVLRYLASQPEIELVGVRCYSEDKEGKDPAELAGMRPCGIAATRDVDALLALDADCVIYTPRSTLSDHTAPGSPDQVLEDDLVAILESGKNVVSSIGSFMHWRHLENGEESFKRINDAGARGDASAYFTGIDPGFTDCVLGATLASLTGEIRQIRTWEMLDYSTYMVTETLAAMGFGGAPEQMPASTDPIMASWGGTIHTLADACGLVLDEIEMGGDIWISPESYTPHNGLVVEAGTVGAIQFSLSGKVDGEARLQLNHINRLGSHAAPDWPSLGDGGGYRVEVDGFPSVRGDFPFALPGGTGDGLEDAMAFTAGRLINSIGPVVAAAPGHLTPNDLPLIGPRYGMEQPALVKERV